MPRSSRQFGEGGEERKEEKTKEFSEGIRWIIFESVEFIHLGSVNYNQLLLLI